MANAQDAADSKLNLRTNSLLRMPAIFLKSIFMIQEFLFLILKMVLKVFTYRRFSAKGQDLENMIQFVKSTPNQFSCNRCT